MSIDAQVLKKKISRTSDESVRALLGSLLLYVLDRAERPQRAEDEEHRGSRPLQSQEAGRRPTRFQLLQAKFMGSGREFHLKRTREVGRLISRDKQGPGKSLVSATINKLMEKTKEGASSANQRPLTNEKPRWGPPGGKNTVKNILKKFLAAEEKEAKEKEAQNKPPAQWPGAARGLLPKIMGRSSVLSKLRERFEQNSCLRSEAGVLPLHREGRKSKSLQKKKVHRPQVRVLHIATMATSCTRTPPARFLACTAEPLPALSIATIVGGPQSWLSHCAKISHLESRHWPSRKTSISSNSEDMEPGGDKSSGSLSEESKGQLRPSKFSVLQTVAPIDSHMTLNMESVPQSGSPSMSCEGKVLPDHMPMPSSLGLASPSPRDARPGGEDRTVKPKAQWVAEHTQRVKEDTGVAPEITMTMCSSEDEAGRASPDSERVLLFATQGQLPEQEAMSKMPTLAPPTVQAERRVQPALESPQITVQLPVVHEMPALSAPLQNTASHEDKCSHIVGGETLTDNTQAVFSTATEDRRDCQAPVILSKHCGIPASPGPATEHGAREDLRDAALVNGDSPPMVLTPTLSKDRKETRLSLENPHDPWTHGAVSGQSVSDLNQEKLPVPEPAEMPTHNRGATSYFSALKSLSEGGTCPDSGPQQEASTTALVPSQYYIRPQSSNAAGKSTQYGQKEHQRPLEEPVPPLRVASENISQDLSTSQSSLDKEPMISSKVSEEVTAGRKVTSNTTSQLGGVQDPEHKTMPQLDGAQNLEHKKMPWSDGVQDTEHMITPQPQGAQDPKHKKMPWLDRVQDPEYNKTTPSDGVQDPEHKIMLQANEVHNTSQPGGTQDTKFKIMPQADGAQDTDHKITPCAGGAQNAENKTTLWAGSVQDTEDKITQESSSRHFSAPSRSSKHKSEAIEGSISGYIVQSQLQVSEPPAALPGKVEGSCLVPAKSQPCISSESAEAKSSASPQKSPAGYHSQSQLPSTNQQALHRKSPKQDQLPPPSAAHSLEHPSGPAMSAETSQVGQGQGQVPSAPTLQEDHRAAPQAESLESEAKDRHLTQEDIERPESHLEPQGTGTGHRRSHQAGQPDTCAQRRAEFLAQKATVCVTEPPPRAAQVQVEDEKIPVLKEPHQHKDRGQEPRRSSARQERSPAQGDRSQATASPATPGNPGRLHGLAAQAETQGLGQSNQLMPQGRGEPDRTTEGILTAGTSGEPPSQTPIVISQGSPCSQHLPQGSKCLTVSITETCPLEPMGSSPWPTPDARSQQPHQPSVQDGLTSTAREERHLPDLKHRRSVHFAKYHAQSFSDQRAFDLSFRPTVLRASDTFEPPK